MGYRLASGGCDWASPRHIADSGVSQETPRAPIHVTVQGKEIDWADIDAFMRSVYAQHRRLPEISEVRKEPTAMPPDARYVSYQGRDPGPPLTEIVWISADARPFADPRVIGSARQAYDEYAAAMALAVMDDGGAGPTLEAIYANTPADRKDRLALGASFAKALADASDQTAAFAAEEVHWIHSHVVPGMTRSAAYDALRSRGLTAYNRAFIKGKPTPPIPGSAGQAPIIGCSWTDQTSGAWPYRGEPLPEQEGSCARMLARQPASIPNPDAVVTLGGPFNLGCSWSTRIVLSFGDDDRVKAVDIDKSRPTCG